MSRAAEAMMQNIEIDVCRGAEDLQAFTRLNVEWLEKYFVIEPEDTRVLSEAQALILDAGGQIFMARVGGVAVGTCALMRVDDEAMEFAKMGVHASMQGRGIGKMMMRTAIDWAKTQGVKTILICTHHSLTTAIRIYREAGFVDSHDPRHHHYERADTFLELHL